MDGAMTVSVECRGSLIGRSAGKIITLLIVLFFHISFAAAQDNTPQPEDQKLERTRVLLQEATAQTASATPSWKPAPEGELASAGKGVMKSLVLCLGVFLVGMAVYKKYFMPKDAGSARHIRVIEKTPLNNRSLLALVEVDGKRVLVSCGVDSMNFMELTAGDKGEAHVFEESLKAACVKE